MLEALRNLLKRLMKIENAPTIVALLVSLGVVILDLLNLVSQDTVFVTVLFSIGVLALGTLVERVTYLDRIEDRITRLGATSELGGISRVFQRRDQLPEYQGYISSSRAEILITGLALATTTVRFLDLLKSKAKSGCSVKILLIAPMEDEEGRAILQSLGRMIGTSEDILKKQIESSLEYLANALRNSDAKTRAKFEVRTYRLNPTYGVLAVDGNLPTGKILLAMYPYRCSEVNWPVLELKPQDGQPGLYSFFYERTKQMWLDAVPWTISTSQD